MKSYDGVEVINEFINEPISSTDSPFYISLADSQKRILFESGRYAVINAKRIEDIPYMRGQEVHVTYSGPCVIINSGQEIRNNETVPTNKIDTFGS